VCFLLFPERGATAHAITHKKNKERKNERDGAKRGMAKDRFGGKIAKLQRLLI